MLLVGLGTLFFPCHVSAVQGAPAVFDLLAGSWVGEGTLQGSPASFRMTWEVEGPLATLRFRNALVREDGTESPVLQAVATYRTEGEAEGVWLDSRGVRIELAWAELDRALTVRWTAPDERGRTTYRVEGPGALEVVDEVESEGARRVFARARYVRGDARDKEIALRSLALRVHDLEAMRAFYAGLLGMDFRPVVTGPVRSWFGEAGGVTLKLVPIRADTDFVDFPVHQPGFHVPDVEAAVALAVSLGGRLEGDLVVLDGVVLEAAVRDPDGNTVELFATPP